MTVGREAEARTAWLARRRHIDAALGQRVGGGETTDAAADAHSKPIRAHGLLRRRMVGGHKRALPESPSAGGTTPTHHPPHQPPHQEESAAARDPCTLPITPEAAATPQRSRTRTCVRSRAAASAR